MELFDNFGARIKNLREEQNISQVRLSEKSGIMREQISRIENGQINATLETIFKLSLGLGVKMTDIVDFFISQQSRNLFLKHSKEYRIKPFVKWAGGKTQLLEKIKELMPETYNKYYEPFVGGGALFLNLSPKTAVINDFNYELVVTFRCFQDDVLFERLVERLKEHETNHSEEYFYEVRNMDRDCEFKKLPSYEIAARFIYLNKACFNGLFRVNSKGYFNVPSGKKEKVHAYNKENFNALFEFLSNGSIEVRNQDFEKAVRDAEEGDFVYFDPPYDVFDEKDSFTSYSKDGFGKKEQKRLADTFKALNEKGVLVMLSNHNTKYIQELYKDFNIHIVLAKRLINSNADGRGDVEEVIITNY